MPSQKSTTKDLVKSQKKEDFINTLPDEILLTIFSFLGRKNISSVQRVCKRFKTITSNNFFYKNTVDFYHDKIEFTNELKVPRSIIANSSVTGVMAAAQKPGPNNPSISIYDDLGNLKFAIKERKNYMALEFSQDGSSLFAMDNDEIDAWNLKSKKKTGTYSNLIPKNENIDNAFLKSLPNNQFLAVYGIKSKKQIHMLEYDYAKKECAHKNTLSSVEWDKLLLSHDNKLLISQYEFTIKVYEVKSAKLLVEFTLPFSLSKSSIIMAITSDNSKLICGGNDKNQTIYICDLASKTLKIEPFKVDYSYVESITLFDRDRKIAVSGDSQMNITFYDLIMRKRLNCFTTGTKSIDKAISNDKNGNLILAGDNLTIIRRESLDPKPLKHKNPLAIVKKFF